MREKASAVRERRPPAIGEAPINTFLRSLVRPLVVAIVAGAFLALIGALSTGRLPLGPRLAYWIGLSVVGSMLGTAVERGVGKLWPGLESLWWRALVIIALLTPPMTVLVWFASGRSTLTPRTALAYLGVTLLVTCAMTALMILAARRPVVTHAAPPQAPPPRFLDRLPPRLRGGEIWAVEAEDHYLRLHTSKGQDLILLRLSDAVAELEGIEGAQTHRSWWVAKAAVRGAKRGDGRATLTLEGGVEAPVSRAYARSLREAGWY